jgi:hypothetical protein
MRFFAALLFCCLAGASSGRESDRHVLKVVEVDFADIDIGHARSRRTLVQPLDQLSCGIALTDDEYFHASIGQVARVAADTELGGFLSRRGAKEHTLDEAGHKTAASDKR